MKSESEVAQLCPTLCDPVDCNLQGSTVHGILQARVLEWVAIVFSRGLPNPGIEPGSPALEADALTSEPPGKQMPGWIKHKLESRLLGEISVTSDMQMTPPLWQKEKN